MGYGDFSQTALLKHLVRHKAECTKCHKNALEIQLDVHHINHKKEDTDYKNIEILCIDCHTIIVSLEYLSLPRN